MLRSGEGVSYSLVSLLNVVIEMSKRSRKLGAQGLFILTAGSLARPRPVTVWGVRWVHVFWPRRGGPGCLPQCLRGRPVPGLTWA